jgi:hypothetical protein
VAKSGLVLFHEAIEHFSPYALEESFERFERAAAKGHEESIWIGSVVQDVEMKRGALKEVIAKTEEPLGWFLAGKFLGGREQFDVQKKSAEGGCSWGQAEYGWYFSDGQFVEKDKTAYVEWIKKAAKQKNPEAMDWLGDWFRNQGGNGKEKAVSYYRAAAELGWSEAISSLATMLKDGEGCAKDLRQAAIWGAQAPPWASTFWDTLQDARMAYEGDTAGNLDCDFNQLCYALGWGLYWYQYGREKWNKQSDNYKAFGERCLDYYFRCVELQQKSIFTFLSYWNRTSGGVKDVGVMIGKMGWEGREDNLVMEFE